MQLSVPIFAGGYVNSTVRQATAAADEAREAYEYARDDLQLRVKREFDALKAGISRVRALEIALASADQVVLSNQKGVLAGTRTTLDVLIVEQQRFNTQVDLAQARYQLLVVVGDAARLRRRTERRSRSRASIACSNRRSRHCRSVILVAEDLDLRKSPKHREAALPRHHR